MSIKAQAFSSSVEDAKKTLNLSLENQSIKAPSAFDQGSSKTSINLDTQQINVSLAQSNPLDKDLLRRALGDSRQGSKLKQSCKI